MTLSPHPHVHFGQTSFIVFAFVDAFAAFGDGAAEEAFTAFAGEGAVVIAGSAVAADQALFLPAYALPRRPLSRRGGRRRG